MANTIKIKRGTGNSILADGELGFNTSTNTLYIGNGGNKILGGRTSGRNLLACLPLSRLPFGTGDSSGTKDDSTGEPLKGTVSYDTGSEALQIINKNSNTRLWLRSNMPVRQGETYVVSCWVASAEPDTTRGEEYQFQISFKNSTTDSSSFGYIDRNKGNFYSFLYKETIKGGDIWTWRVYYQIFTVPENANFASIAFRTGFDFEKYNNNFFVKNFKIEQGSVYTEWTPAPEEMVLRDTPTNGEIYISKASGDAYFHVIRSDTGKELLFGIGSDGTNRGIYDITHGKWMLLINDSGISLGSALPIGSGGTGATTVDNAILNLGLAAPGYDIPAANANEWEQKARAYILEKAPTNGVKSFNIGWQGASFGSGIAWRSGGEVNALVLNKGATGGFKFWRHINGNWEDDSALSIASGGTGATTAAGALTNLGALSKSGGTIDSQAYFTWADAGHFNQSGVSYPYTYGGLRWSGESDGVQLYAEETAADNLDLILHFTDDSSNKLQIRNHSRDKTLEITANGRINAYSSLSSGYASMWADEEGGNFEIKSKSGAYIYQMDAVGNDYMRLIAFKNVTHIQTWTFGAEDGKFSAPQISSGGALAVGGILYANNTIQAKTTGTWAIDVNNPNGGEASIGYSQSNAQKWVLGVGCGGSGGAFALWNVAVGGLTLQANADNSVHFYGSVGVGGNLGVTGDANLYRNVGISGTLGVSGETNLYNNVGIHGSLSITGHVASSSTIYANQLEARLDNDSVNTARLIVRNGVNRVHVTASANERGFWDNNYSQWVLKAPTNSNLWESNVHTANASYEFYAHNSSQSGHFRGGVDGEGGYWEIKSKNGIYSYQFDAHQDTGWRLYAWENATGTYTDCLTYNATTNTIHAPNLTLNNAMGISYGGTGANTAEGARANLYAAAQWVEGFTPAGARNKTLTDLLQISLDSQTWNDYDFPCWVGTEGGGLTPCPVEGVFYAYREVRKISDHQIMVTLTESYPRPGRVWTRTYDKNYQAWLPQEGWACNETIHYGSNAPTGILKGTIWLKPIN